MERIESFKQNINFSDPELLSTYGLSVQQNLAKFSEEVLADVRSREVTEVGTLLNQLMLTVKGIDVEGMTNPGPLMRIWNKILSEVSLFRGQFEKVNDQLDHLISELEESKRSLVDDTRKLDKTYQKNLDYFYDLESLITAAEEVLLTKRQELDHVSVDSNDYLALQKLQDERSVVKEFDKRIHDLKLTKMVIIQTLPQIRLIQHNNNELVNKIQTTVLNTIPIWRNQIILSFSLDKQKRVAELQSKIHETTNTILTRNSQLLKENSLNVAKLTETGIVETKTLQKMNDDMVSVISGVLKIYEDGRAKRKLADKELSEMERRLKASLQFSIAH